MNISTVEKLQKATFRARALFYAVTPGESSPKTLEEVPEMVAASFPYFFTMILLELAVAKFGKNKRGGIGAYFQVNDSITSVSAGLLSRLTDLFTHTIELASYIWFYERFHVYEMPIDSPWTWLFMLLAFDFAYYWFHRASHEINFLWAFHQTHHSSEYFNLTTALRQAVIQKYGSFIFYLPIALVVPPPMFAMHVQLNLIYQFWIHTEMIGRLWWPLELVLNTASHHRVHHGRNPYCIDKNYAGFLIIWDRIFGTFQPEKDDEDVVYGLVHNIKSFDPIWCQVNHFRDVWRKFSRSPHKLRALLFGPGYMSKKPQFRLGDPKDLPAIEPNPKPHNPPVPKWLLGYSLVHYVVAAAFYSYVLDLPQKRPLDIAIWVAVFLVATTQTFGNIFNRRGKLAAAFEITRCAVFAWGLPTLAEQCEIKSPLVQQSLQIFYAVSILPWLILESPVDAVVTRKCKAGDDGKESQKTQ